MAATRARDMINVFVNPPISSENSRPRAASVFPNGVAVKGLSTYLLTTLVTIPLTTIATINSCDNT